MGRLGLSKLGIALLLAACLSLATVAIASQTMVIGREPAVAETTSIARLMADPQAYAGKIVRVEGKVLDVCPKKGCWMELSSEGGSVRIKVEDDVLVFPREGKGGRATAEGVVQIQEMTKEQFTGWMRHLAEERGETFDPASVGTGPYRIVQIQGTGARLELP